MKALALLCLAAGDPEEVLERVRRAAPPEWTGTLAWERHSKTTERRARLTGPVRVRTGSALYAEVAEDGPRARPLRIWVRDGRAVSIQGRSGKARVERFHPLELWRSARVPEGFGAALEEAEPLPPAVSGLDGRPVAPVRPTIPGLAAAPGAAEPEEAVVVLLPGEASLARRIRSVRLFVVGSRIARIEVDTPHAVETWTVGEVEAAEAIEDAVFEVDLTGFEVEER